MRQDGDSDSQEAVKADRARLCGALAPIGEARFLFPDLTRPFHRVWLLPCLKNPTRVAILGLFAFFNSILPLIRKRKAIVQADRAVVVVVYLAKIFKGLHLHRHPVSYCYGLNVYVPPKLIG